MNRKAEIVAKIITLKSKFFVHFLTADEYASYAASDNQFFPHGKNLICLIGSDKKTDKVINYGKNYYIVTATPLDIRKNNPRFEIICS